MRELVYQVEFLSDIVLPATSNTEGNTEQLDFIPGSNFLGMVAKEYPGFSNSFDLFHSGKVRFGDATILSGGKPSYKMPLCFFQEKTDAKKLRNQIFSLDDLVQPKQLRNGYISQDKTLTHIAYNYAQKSAYDKASRRSKDSSMYGYSAIKSGTKWQFTVKYDASLPDEDIALLQKTLEKSTRLGKSKSSQYGQVRISQTGESENIEDVRLNDETVLYFGSRVALVDEEGNPTYDLTAICRDLTEENIVHEKTQIRTSTFTPYNARRQTKDYERVCINKGSVVVLKDVKIEQLEEIRKGVGAYLSEGFGEVLINPNFLMSESVDLKKPEKTESAEEAVEINEPLALYLLKRQNLKEARLKLANEVQDFISKHAELYTKKMNSQWGTIRSLCALSSEQSIVDDVESYISKGVAKEKWKGEKASKLLNAIKGSSDKLAFTKLLATQMPKVKEQKGAKND